MDKVILVSHLQDITDEVGLAGMPSGVDVIVGAGGGELLADPGDPVAPDGTEISTPYPIEATDADLDVVPVVTTPGLDSYLGRLVVTFDEHGELISVDDELSRPLVVAAQGPDAVQPDGTVLRRSSSGSRWRWPGSPRPSWPPPEVGLNGIRAEIRSRETNSATWSRPRCWPPAGAAPTPTPA